MCPEKSQILPDSSTGNCQEEHSNGGIHFEALENRVSLVLRSLAVESKRPYGCAVESGLDHAEGEPPG